MEEMVGLLYPDYNLSVCYFTSKRWELFYKFVDKIEFNFNQAKSHVEVKDRRVYNHINYSPSSTNQVEFSSILDCLDQYLIQSYLALLKDTMPVDNIKPNTPLNDLIAYEVQFRNASVMEKLLPGINIGIVASEISSLTVRGNDRKVVLKVGSSKVTNFVEMFC